MAPDDVDPQQVEAARDRLEAFYIADCAIRADIDVDVYDQVLRGHTDRETAAAFESSVADCDPDAAYAAAGLDDDAVEPLQQMADAYARQFDEQVAAYREQLGDADVRNPDAIAAELENPSDQEQELLDQLEQVEREPPELGPLPEYSTAPPISDLFWVRRLFGLSYREAGRHPLDCINRSN